MLGFELKTSNVKINIIINRFQAPTIGYSISLVYIKEIELEDQYIGRSIIWACLIMNFI